MSRVDTLWGLIGPWLDAEHLELDDLELKGSGRGRTLRVVIDGDEGVDLDRLAELSNGISRLLDSETDMDEPYQLEVTSPGLERHLRRPRHYEKSVGREVSVKARTDEGTVVVKGTLENADGERISVRAEGGSTHELRLDQVVTARTVFRWEKSPKPGKK